MGTRRLALVLQLSLVLALLLCSARHTSAVRRLGIRNHRAGTSNSSSDAHDGPIVQWEADGPFYRYAMTYTKCFLEGEPGTIRGILRRWLNWFVQSAHGTGFNCGQIVTSWLSDGFGRDCGFKSPENGQTVAVYTSTDLQNWKYIGDALEGAPSWLISDSILFRPAVLRNPITKNYVLWVNRLPRDEPVVESYRRAGFIVGVSSRPEGPFWFPSEETDAMPRMQHAGGADFSLLFDKKTNDAYIAYGSWHNYLINEGWKSQYYPEWMREGHQIAIQKLDPSTFTRPDPDANFSITVTGQSEAPSFFQRGDFYYLVHGSLCCFCARGGDARVLAAQSPYGPYIEVAQLNSMDSSANPNRIKGQNSDVIEIDVVDLNGSGHHREYLWSIDMWFSGASGWKSDDHQYWEPLRFDETVKVVFEEGQPSVSVPIPKRILGGDFVDCFELNVSGAAGRLDVGCDEANAKLKSRSFREKGATVAANRKQGSAKTQL